jgi:hypothetical protein
MRGILSFTLPEESAEFKQACSASDWIGLVWDLDQWLRSEIKYHDRNELQPARDKLYELLDEANLTLDD